MLVDTIKARALEAMKAKDALATSILRLALGEIQTLEARSNRAATDDEAAAVVRKLVKSNEETLAVAEAPEQRATLERELAILRSVLPAALDVDQIVAALASVEGALKQAKNDGQATGIAMKHLKAAGASVSGNDVTAAVKRIRG